MNLRPSFHCSRLSLFAVVVLVLGCSSPQQPSSSLKNPPNSEQREQQQPLVVFVVRHAEKVDESRDPELSPDGVVRAKSLALVLRDCEIEQVHSTDFKRTRDTAAPTANKLNVEVQLYDAADPAGLVKQLRSAGGRHLVVGHSNTVPKMVELLGGEPGPEIGSSEYDRLYIVMIGRDGETTTVQMRFGQQLVKRQ